MNATLELIQAKQNAVQAEKDLALAKAKAALEARIRIFAPIRQIIEEAADLLAKVPSRYPQLSIRPKNDYVIGSWIERTTVQASGGYHFHNKLPAEVKFVSCQTVVTANEDGTFELFYGYSRNRNKNNATLEEARDAVIERLAELAA